MEPCGPKCGTSLQADLELFKDTQWEELLKQC